MVQPDEEHFWTSDLLQLVSFCLLNYFRDAAAGYPTLGLKWAIKLLLTLDLISIQKQPWVNFLRFITFHARNKKFTEVLTFTYYHKSKKLGLHWTRHDWFLFYCGDTILKIHNDTGPWQIYYSLPKMSAVSDLCHLWKRPCMAIKRHIFSFLTWQIKNYIFFHL